MEVARDFGPSATTRPMCIDDPIVEKHILADGRSPGTIPDLGRREAEDFLPGTGRRVHGRDNRQDLRVVVKDKIKRISPKARAKARTPEISGCRLHHCLHL